MRLVTSGRVVRDQTQRRRSEIIVVVIVVVCIGNICIMSPAMDFIDSGRCYWYPRILQQNNIVMAISVNVHINKYICMYAYTDICVHTHASACTHMWVVLWKRGCQKASNISFFVFLDVRRFSRTDTLEML